MNLSQSSNLSWLWFIASHIGAFSCSKIRQAFVLYSTYLICIPIWPQYYVRKIQSICCTVVKCPMFALSDHRSHASEWFHSDVHRRRVQRPRGQPDAGDGAPPALSASLPALPLLPLEDGRPPTTPLQTLYRYNGTNAHRNTFKGDFIKLYLWVIFLPYFPGCSTASVFNAGVSARAGVRADRRVLWLAERSGVLPATTSQPQRD